MANVPYKKSDEARFYKLRADALAKRRILDDFAISMAVKYGSDQTARQWASRGEKTKWDKLVAASDKASGKVHDFAQALNPHRQFERGFPSSWVAREMTFADAVTLDQMSVTPPSSYGYTQGEMVKFSGPIVEPRNHARGVVRVRRHARRTSLGATTVSEHSRSNHAGAAGNGGRKQYAFRHATAGAGGDPFAFVVLKGQAPDRALAHALSRRLKANSAGVQLWPTRGDIRFAPPDSSEFRTTWTDRDGVSHEEYVSLPLYGNK